MNITSCFTGDFWRDTAVTISNISWWTIFKEFTKSSFNIKSNPFAIGLMCWRSVSLTLVQAFRLIIGERVIQNWRSLAFSIDVTFYRVFSSSFRRWLFCRRRFFRCSYSGCWFIFTYAFPGNIAVISITKAYAVFNMLSNLKVRKKYWLSSYPLLSRLVFLLLLIICPFLACEAQPRHLFVCVSPFRLSCVTSSQQL